MATAAAKINSLSESTGVSATARNQVNLTTFVAGGSYSLAIKGDNATASNVTFSVSAAGATAGGLAEAVKGFNDVSSQTGITAKLNDAGDGVLLIKESGANIQIQNNSLAGNTLAVGAFDAAASASTGTPTFVAGIPAAPAPAASSVPATYPTNDHLNPASQGKDAILRRNPCMPLL